MDEVVPTPLECAVQAMASHLQGVAVDYDGTVKPVSQLAYSPAVRVGDTVYYYTAGGNEPNFAVGTQLAAIVTSLCDEPGRVNLNVFMPVGCGCFKKHDCPQSDGEPLAGSWAFRE